MEISSGDISPGLSEVQCAPAHPRARTPLKTRKREKKRRKKEGQREENASVELPTDRPFAS